MTNQIVDAFLTGKAKHALAAAVVGFVNECPEGIVNWEGDTPHNPRMLVPYAEARWSELLRMCERILDNWEPMQRVARSAFSDLLGPAKVRP